MASVWLLGTKFGLKYWQTSLLPFLIKREKKLRWSQICRRVEMGWQVIWQLHTIFLKVQLTKILQNLFIIFKREKSTLVHLILSKKQSYTRDHIRGLGVSRKLVQKCDLEYSTINATIQSTIMFVSQKIYLIMMSIQSDSIATMSYRRG